jgi:dUTP pyrophosphatase
MQIKFKKIHEEAVIPKYAKLGDAGMDLHSIEETAILPGEHKLVKTGLQMQIPLGYEAQVRPRSGLALKNKITVLNTPGTVDSGYRGEIGVILMNHSQEIFKINKHDRIAQMVIAKHETPEIQEVEELDNSERGEGGFGSTGN